MKYFVEDGKSITCKKGTLGPHAEVTPAALGAADKAAGEKQLESLIERDLVYKAEKSKAQEAAEKAEAAAKKKAADAKKKAEAK